MASVTLKRVSKSYAAGPPALRDVSLTVRDHEFVVLVGPSGCGKSTILRIIAGLEEVTSGEVLLDGRLANDLAPGDRDVALVFQNYALYPHMAVRDNIGFALKVRRLPRRDIERRVQEAAATLGITALLGKLPRQLSGGERQRVALGRAIVRDPRIFLFDEPLSNLDAKLRSSMRAEIAALHRRLGVTTVYVTHDQVEAMTLGDRIVVLKDGVVMQSGAPLELYRKPANRFVAGFLGSPPMNFLPATLPAGDPSVLQVGGINLPLPETLPCGIARRELVLGIRPMDVHLAPAGGLPARVTLVEPTGSETYIHAAAADTALVLRAPPGEPPIPGAEVALELDLSAAHFFEAASGERL